MSHKAPCQVHGPSSLSWSLELQLRSTWCSPEKEPQTILCPSCAPLAFGAPETGLYINLGCTMLKTQQDEGISQLQFTSRNGWGLANWPREHNG